MDEACVTALDKELKRLKRIATEWAGQLHDLAEERLPAGYEVLPELSLKTYEACQAWAEANARLRALQQDVPTP